MGDLVASLTAVTKSYRMDDVTVPVLQGIEVEIRPAYFTVLLGPSGSGKTTLLNLIGCLDRPDAGKVVVAGTDAQPIRPAPSGPSRAAGLGYVPVTGQVLTKAKALVLRIQ